MKLKFWGVRGSIPCPGPNTVKYGGNTPCMELRLGEEERRLIILDAGSGIRELGNYIMAHDLPKGPLEIDIFLSHTHWDHIMGFPFFTPSYLPNTKLRIYGPVTFEGNNLDQVMGGQMIYEYFPVRRVELAAAIEYFELKEGRIDLGDGLTVTTKYLNHPLLCLGYRFEYQGKVLCTAFDTEPFRNLFLSDPEDSNYDEALAQEGQLVADEQNQAVEQFIAGADLLIQDAQYTRQEYESTKLGWGHTSYEYACEAASRAGVKVLVLFHHDPARTDAQLDELAATYCEPGRYGDMKVFFAREGMEFEL
jgi:phosphoribosyl 1,2-cyclic phosphodiesterase